MIAFISSVSLSANGRTIGFDIQRKFRHDAGINIIGFS